MILKYRFTPDQNAIDLHVHSTKSDGTCTPAEIVTLAKETGLKAIALTDHDTTEGIDEAVHAGLLAGIEVIPGIELSTENVLDVAHVSDCTSAHDGPAHDPAASAVHGGPSNGSAIASTPGPDTQTAPAAPGRRAPSTDIHILGYFLNYRDPAFREQVLQFSNARDFRNRKMCSLLCADGIPVPYDALMAENKGAVVTRAQFGRYMFEHGIVSSISEAFEKYIGDDCKYFVPREKITPDMAVSFIRRFHGAPVLAHPFQYGYDARTLDALVARLKVLGLTGLECIYGRYTPDEIRTLERLADKYDLAVTGGSDYHGQNKPGLELGTGYSGKLYVPERCLTDLKHRLFGTTDQTKIFFLDMDGTLLTTDKKITPATNAALRNFAARGNRVVLCSGRALPDIWITVNKLGLGDIPGLLICGYNGALLQEAGPGSAKAAGTDMTPEGPAACSGKRDFDDPPAQTAGIGTVHDARSNEGSRIVFAESIPMDHVRKVFALAKETGVYVQTYTDEAIVTKERTKETDFYTVHHPLPVRTVGENGDVTTILSHAPCKCIAIANDHMERLETLRKRITENFSDTLSAFYSSPCFLEIVSKYAGKGTAVKRVAAMLGVPITNTFAAGDSENDVSMIIAAGTGIAMRNALQESVKKAADVVTTEDNDHDGLVPFLQIT